MGQVLKCPSCQEYGAHEMADQGYRLYNACVACGYGWWVDRAISHDEVPPTQRNSTVVPRAPVECEACQRALVKAPCGALMCHRCGTWATSCHKSKCDSLHLPPRVMTRVELLEDEERTTETMRRFG